MAFFRLYPEARCSIQMQSTDESIFRCVQAYLSLGAGKVNAAQQVVLTFPDLFDNSWLHTLYEEAQVVVDEHQFSIKSAVREQLDYRLLLKSVEGHQSWLSLYSKNPLNSSPMYFIFTNHTQKT